MADALGLGATLWSPLGGGLLTGKYRHNAERRLTTLGQLVHTEDTAQKSMVVGMVLEVADELGTAPVQAAMAWLRHRAAIATTGLVPVFGPREVSHLDAYLAALDVELSEGQYQRLDKVSRTRSASPTKPWPPAPRHCSAARVSTSGPDRPRRLIGRDTVSKACPEPSRRSRMRSSGFRKAIR